MRVTDQSLMDQMRISLREIARRKELLGLHSDDFHELVALYGSIQTGLDQVIHAFYEDQTSILEIRHLIGDSETLQRLKTAQHQYLIDLFSGHYDERYVNNRLRIGLVHKRIEVEPHLYISSLTNLKQRIFTLIRQHIGDDIQYYQRIEKTLEALFMFDMTLVFETYVWSLVNEINSAKSKVQEYAETLELHAKKMEDLSRLDPLTGLFNTRCLIPLLNDALAQVQAKQQGLTLLFIDINDFKQINDLYGHIKGDLVITYVANTLKQLLRTQDVCFRYGGDEFVVILPNCTKVQAEETLIPRLQAQMMQFTPRVTLSIGMQQSNPFDQDSDASDLLKSADAAMYEAKDLHKKSSLL